VLAGATQPAAERTGHALPSSVTLREGHD